VALGWNVAGLLTLANAITLSALTAPGLDLIHGEVPNIAIGALPFTHIAVFFEPPLPWLFTRSLFEACARD
jgi:hypothetical protein